MKTYSQLKFPDLDPIIIRIKNNIILEIVSAIPVGVTFDQHLKWDTQIDTLHNVTNSRLYLLKCIRSYLTPQCRLQFYYALIYPNLLYCCTLWGNANKELITNLLKLQKRAARLILEQPTEVPSILLFRSLNWIPIFNLIKMRKIIMVFNTLKTSWPPDLRKLFVFVPSKVNLRYRYMGASLFNSLPAELKIFDNIIHPTLIKTSSKPVFFN